MLFNVRTKKDGIEQWCGLRFQVYVEKGKYSFFGERLTEYVNVKNKHDKITIRRYIDLSESKRTYGKLQLDYMVMDISKKVEELLKEYKIEYDSFYLSDSYYDE